MPDFALYCAAMGAAIGAAAAGTFILGYFRRSSGPGWRNAACLLGIVLGFIAGGLVLRLPFGWPPTSALGRLLMIVFPAAIGVELVAGIPRAPRWIGVILRLALSAVVARVLWHGSIYLSGRDAEWTTWNARAALVACGALLATVWFLLPGLSRRKAPASIPLALSMTILAAGLTVMLRGYLAGGEATLPAAGALAGVALVGLLIGWTEFRGAIGFGVVALFGFLFVGRFFGSISTATAVTLFLAPLLCWVTEIPPLRHRNTWLIAAIRLALVAIPLTVVLAAAKRHFDQETAPLLGAARSRSGNSPNSHYSSRAAAWHFTDGWRDFWQGDGNSENSRYGLENAR